MIEQVGDTINPFKKVTARERKSLTAVGFGIPGFITGEGVVLTTHGLMEFMEAYPLKMSIENQFFLPCLTGNDARIISLGEALYGKGTGHKDGSVSGVIDGAGDDVTVLGFPPNCDQPGANTDSSAMPFWGLHPQE